jgi:4-hydroxybenzoate polyprenyltransferase
MLEFLDFIRIKICLFCISIAVLGFLLFNEMSINLIFVICSAFFLCASLFAYNNIADKEEDVINKERVNPLTLTKKGFSIIIFCFIVGLIFALALSLFSAIIYLLSSFIGFTYSIFKLKRYLVLKNLYSGFSWSLSFLLGVSLNFNYISFVYYVIVSLFISISSIVSDLRDFKGDKICNIKTIPISIGFNKSKKLIYLLYVLFSLFIFLGRFNEFLIFILFCISIIILVNKNKIKLAHNFSGFVFILYDLQLLISLMMKVV